MMSERWRAGGGKTRTAPNRRTRFLFGSYANMIRGAGRQVYSASTFVLSLNLLVEAELENGGDTGRSVSFESVSVAC